MREIPRETYIWKVCDVITEAPAVQSLILEAIEERPSFIGGQYLTVRLPGFEPAEGKSYSIASGEHDPLVCLTIKEIGAFSKALAAHTVSSTLTTSAPYGFFYPEESDTNDLVFVAGGIGITPCMSIIKTLIHKNTARRITLFYSNRTLENCIFKDELDALSAAFPTLTIVYHLTRESQHASVYAEGRMTGTSLVSALTDPNASDFFVCGSIDFTKSMWGELRTVGIPSTHIYTEGYF